MHVTHESLTHLLVAAAVPPNRTRGDESNPDASVPPEMTVLTCFPPGTFLRDVPNGTGLSYDSRARYERTRGAMVSASVSAAPSPAGRRALICVWDTHSVASATVAPVRKWDVTSYVAKFWPVMVTEIGAPRDVRVLPNDVPVEEKELMTALSKENTFASVPMRPCTETTSTSPEFSEGCPRAALTTMNESDTHSVASACVGDTPTAAPCE
mmetsp:Transcript_23114/g.54996  ORF Transcript_23114/g.54996 Transcript_23114/m.54996 type:complete len:211 (+) Transcript_23114:281-913(+)